MTSCKSEFKKAIGKLREAQKVGRRVDYQIAVQLHEIWSRQLWRAAYRGFDPFVDRECGGMTRTQARQLSSLIAEGVPREAFERVGWSKLTRMMTIRVSHPADYSALLAVAHSIPRSELIARVHAVCGRYKDETPTVTLTGKIAAHIQKCAREQGLSIDDFVWAKVSQTIHAPRRRQAAA